MLLVWMKADMVLWYYIGFAVPSIVFSCIIIPLWSKAKYGMACYRIKVIQRCAWAGSTLFFLEPLSIDTRNAL